MCHTLGSSVNFIQPGLAVIGLGIAVTHDQMRLVQMGKL